MLASIVPLPEGLFPFPGFISNRQPGVYHLYYIIYLMMFSQPQYGYTRGAVHKPIESPKLHDINRHISPSTVWLFKQI